MGSQGQWSKYIRVNLVGDLDGLSFVKHVRDVSSGTVAAVHIALDAKSAHTPLLDK